jgi:hypothetical protein
MSSRRFSVTEINPHATVCRRADGLVYKMRSSFGYTTEGVDVNGNRVAGKLEDERVKGSERAEWLTNYEDNLRMVRKAS